MMCNNGLTCERVDHHCDMPECYEPSSIPSTDLLAAVKSVEHELSTVECGWTEDDYIAFCLEQAAVLKVAMEANGESSHGRSADAKR